MINPQQLLPIELTESERAARREWQHRSRACGHAWTFDTNAMTRICHLCGRMQVWSVDLKDWTSRAAAERSKKLRTIQDKGRKR